MIILPDPLIALKRNMLTPTSETLIETGVTDGDTSSSRSRSYDYGLDRYHTFAKELLKLSLLGLAGLGFLIFIVIANSDNRGGTYPSPLVAGLLMMAMIALGVTAGASVAVRYFWIDWVNRSDRKSRLQDRLSKVDWYNERDTFFVEPLRDEDEIAADKEECERLRTLISAEEGRMYKVRRRCTRLLTTSCVSFVAATACTVLALSISLVVFRGV